MLVICCFPLMKPIFCVKIIAGFCVGLVTLKINFHVYECIRVVNRCTFNAEFIINWIFVFFMQIDQEKIANITVCRLQSMLKGNFLQFLRVC